MDYMSEPPPEILKAYEAVMPDFAEAFTPPLPMALLHGLQLFWQQQAMPERFVKVRTILPLMQYVAHALGGDAVSEVSSMSCQSHLVDMRNGGPSSVAKRFGWDRLYAPQACAWDVIGALKGELHGSAFKGRGKILAGVHDSNANFLRYLAAGQEHFTLLSTGTWIIGFDTDADIAGLDPSRDIVANKNVFGKTIACCRFFGGKEFELVAQGADGAQADTGLIEYFVAKEVMALPSFTGSGGPVPGTALKGKIVGPFAGEARERASLASLYCALMVSESLDAIHSHGNIIVDGPFSQNNAFLAVLAALRPGQTVYASEARDGTAAGAACLALMPDGVLPQIDVPLRQVAPSTIAGLKAYQATWRHRAQENADV
jgi:sugar (pentulose or hexulose) kinase